MLKTSVGVHPLLVFLIINQMIAIMKIHCSVFQMLLRTYMIKPTGAYIVLCKLLYLNSVNFIYSDFGTAPFNFLVDKVLLS